MQIKNKYYPYPVLVAGNDSYEDSTFSSDADYAIDAHHRRFQRGILVRNDIPIYEYDKLVYRVLKEQGISVIREGDLQGLLQIHSLVYNYIPKELQKSACFKYSNGVFTVL